MQKKASSLAWIAPIAYVASLDSFAIVAVMLAIADDGFYDAADTLMNVLWRLSVGFFFASVVTSIWLAVRGGAARRATLRRAALLTKLGLIPFFAFGALVMAALMMFSLFPALAFIGWIGLPVAGAIGWLAMVGGSPWVIAYAARLQSDGLISAGECALHIISQMLFFIDVADAIILFVRGRRLERRAQSPAPPALTPAGGPAPEDASAS
ncbi:hypothetical protein B5F40_15230 [Gordonibacter sp. An230]|nr:hypothetical protein B5F40_15230 [Gordonibacter sp. An230]